MGSIFAHLNVSLTQLLSPDSPLNPKWQYDKRTKVNSRGSTIPRCMLHGLIQCSACEKPIHHRGRSSKDVRPPVDQQWVTKPAYPSLGSSVCGLLKSDCFRAYPVAASPEVAFGVDYLMEYISPLIFNSLPKYANPVVLSLFPASLQSPALFMGLVTMSVAYADSAIAPAGQPNRRFLICWGMALQLLKEKMKDADQWADDASIIATVNLMGAASRFHWQQAVETLHLGLKAISKYRGSWDSLGPDARRSIQYIDLAGITEYPLASLFEPTAIQDADQSNGHSARESLVYPTVPFSAEMTQSLAKVPQGFVELAMNGFICAELIHLAAKLFQFANQQKKYLIDEAIGILHAELRKLWHSLPPITKIPSRSNASHLICLSLSILCIDCFTLMRLHCMYDVRWAAIKALCRQNIQAAEFTLSEIRLATQLRAWFVLVASRLGNAESGTYHMESKQVEDSLFDYLLIAPKPMKPLNKPNFRFARRWYGDGGLREVLARFYINDRLEVVWLEMWRKHMARLKLPIAREDSLAVRVGSRWTDYSVEGDVSAQTGYIPVC